MSRDFILGPQVLPRDTWFDRTQVSMARSLGESCPAIPPTGGDALNQYEVGLQYYDLPMSEYIVHRKTGDPAVLMYAQKAADSWWKHPGWIGEGRIRKWPNEASPPPRHAGMGGLILRAMDGRPEMWDWIVGYTQAHLNIWLKSRLNNASLHVDIREGAFAFHYAVWVAKTLPDSYPLQAGGIATNGAAIRTQLLADLDKITTDYYERLQYPCGCWRYNADLKDGDGGTLVGITQPFTIGLLLLAFADLHQITTSPVTKESLKRQILKAARHLYVDGMYRKDDSVPYDPAKKWRCFWYLFHGGTTVNPAKFERGGWSLPGVNANEVSDARQSIGPVVAIYGYAYSISGDSFFKTAGDELWDAAYNGTDGIRNLMNTDGKGFNQNCRRAGSYPVWAGQSAIPPMPIPQPTPTPAPIPIPVPVSPPSPDGTEGPAVTDSEGAVWTLGPGSRTLRNGVDVGGAGKRYLYWQKVVYLQGMSDGWFKWTGTAWKSIGTTRPPAPIVQPAPTPIPVPQPVPVPVKEEYVIKTLESVEAARTKLLQEMFGLGYAAWEEVKGIIKFRLFPNP